MVQVRTQRKRCAPLGELHGEDTSTGMILQALSGDEKAWERFANHCQRVISGWCRSWKLSHEDRDDTVQESLLVVLVKVHDFRRTGRGSLRAWLKAVAWRCRCEAIAKARNSQRLQQIQQRFREATNEIEELEQEFERLYELERLERCLLAVRQRVTPQTWAAFQKHAIERIPAPKVAAELGVTVEVVYAARSRVLSLLRAEWRRL